MGSAEVCFIITQDSLVCERCEAVPCFYLKLSAVANSLSELRGRSGIKPKGKRARRIGEWWAAGDRKESLERAFGENACPVHVAGLARVYSHDQVFIRF